jgi:UDP-glucose 4-epimerase
MPGNPSILITGAAGFVGRRLMALLANQGNLVASDFSPDKGSGIEGCDISDDAAVRELFERHNPEAVIHLAALLPTASNLDPGRATRINIGGGLNLLRAAVETGVKRFVFSSSSSVYGYSHREPPPREDDSLAPGDIYGTAKAYVEFAGRRMQALHGLEFVALRIATVVGPGVRNSGSPWRSEIFEKLGGGGPQEICIPSNPEDRASLVHVEDVARMLALLATHEHISHSVYNSPVEAPRFAELKTMVEAADPAVKVQLRCPDLRRLPPPIDGSRFHADFGFQLVPLADRLKQAAQRGR